jgi:5'-nucleotidase
MSQLVRASALGAVALALVIPGTATAKKAPKPKHTVTVNTVDALPKTSKNLNLKCGKSTSAKRIRKRWSSKPTSTRVRTVTTYCSGGTRTRYWIKKVVVTRTVPGPVVTVPAAPAPPRTFRLTLLHNNDGESKYGVGDSIVNYGGITRFKTVLDGLRAQADAFPATATEDKGTVVVSSGDNILAGLNLRASFERKDAGQGSFYDAIALGHIGYDAITIGNHEYDFGPTRLAQLIGADEVKGVPFLTANTDFSGNPDLQALRTAGRIADSTVVVKGGQRIGIIGVTTPDTPVVSSPGATVKFLSDVAGIVNAEAARLSAEGVNKIILSSHLQNLNYEKTLVGSLKNVDIVISGGGDELLANPTDRLVTANGAPDAVRPPVAGEYPALALDADGAAVPVVTTQGEYRYVGRLTVTFDAAGRIVSTDRAKSGPVRVSAWAGGQLTNPTRTVAADPDYAAEDPYLKTNVIEPLNAYKKVLEANKLGTTQATLDGVNANIRSRETNLGDLIADGFRFAANRTAVADGRPLAQIAFSNGGGIRTSINAGDINEKQTFDVLPFDNVIVTVTGVTSAKLKELMEHGVARLPEVDGRFPQISGFTMDVNRTKAVGSRVEKITLADGTVLVNNGTAVAGLSVNVATTNFTAGGGDGYPFTGTTFQFARQPGKDGFYPYQASFADYLTAPTAQGGLNGAVTNVTHPGAGRINFTG